MTGYPRRHARLALAALLLAAAILPCGGRADAGGVTPSDAERDLEPIPRVVIFSDPAEGGHDPASTEIIERELQRSFASLGNVVEGRDLLVKRFGVFAVEALAGALRKDNAQSQTWNAALTIGAMRDTEGPALQIKAAIRPLVRILESSANPQDRAFAALALGCFHWPEGIVPEIHHERAGWYVAVPGPAVLVGRGARAIHDARQQLVRLANDRHPFVRVASLLALAKMGGPDARREHMERELNSLATHTMPARAALLARAFLVVGERKPYLEALRNEDRRVRGTAALAIAVAALQQDAAPWTRDSEPLLKALGFAGTQIDRVLEDGAEAVFARGILALVNQANEEWRELWELAIQHTSKAKLVEAATQVLRFCNLPWFRQEIVRWAAEPPAVLKDPVQALVLLRAGEMGGARSIDALAEWLRSRSKRPVPTTRWDPRWYAAVGLLRALHEGRIRSRAERVRVVEALRKSAAQVMDRKAAFREALRALLDAHGDRLAGAKESALYRLPLADLRRVEAALDCPYGLLARDPVDACVRRVNHAVQLAFGLDGIKPWKAGEATTQQMPERFLKRYLDAYPYFSRLEFRTRRGARPYPRLDPEAQGIDR